MTISSTSGAAAAPAVTDANRTVMVLRKQQDAVKQEGQALVDLIQQPAVDQTGGRFSAYA
jgi:hypothetical protein